MKLRIRFKDPDLIWEYLNSVAPSEKKREKLSKELFEFGDYGMVEIDTVAGTGRLVPKNEWRKP